MASASVLTPRFFRVDQDTHFDYSCTSKKYFVVKPQSGDAAANMNNGENITFSYEGQKKLYRLADPESGFLIKIGYRTRTGANNDSTSNITLANNWFGHLFTTAQFRLGSVTLETINELGTVMDFVNLLKGSEFKNESGEDYTWIPDSELGIAGAFTVADPADVAVPGAAAQANVTATARAAATAVITVVNTALTNSASSIRISPAAEVTAAGATAANIASAANQAATNAIEAVNKIFGKYGIHVKPHIAVGEPGATAAADIAASCNAAATAAVVSINNAFKSSRLNEGFNRRMIKYNYEVENNDTHRYITAFVPLSMIFGCCEQDKLLKSINFEINLTRKQNTAYTEVFYGGANSGVQFGDPATTGILNMSLRLVEYIPNPKLAAAVNPLFAKPIKWTYRQRHCILRSSALDHFDISETKQSVPQFIFVGCKGTTGDSNQKGAVTRNFNLFRHCNIQSVTADLDGESYPNEPQNANFLQNNYSTFYQQFKRACKLLGASECSITSTEYKNLYPIFAIDTSNKPMKLRNAVSNMVVKIVRNAVGNDATPTNPLNVDYYVFTANEKSYDINCETGEVRE